jgi:hypothetical protein
MIAVAAYPLRSTQYAGFAALLTLAFGLAKI